MEWQVYIVLCSDDTLYTGITTDIERRLSEHASGRGAKYFRGRQLKELLYLERGHDRSTASKRELAIKGMKRAEKEGLIAAAPHSCHGPIQRRDPPTHADVQLCPTPPKLVDTPAPTFPLPEGEGQGGGERPLLDDARGFVLNH